ncbi:AzlC family ABC transporter permease [Rubrobacter aplysinae]|uniref:AzlC family ABC transporter permease n=1 Tax=Rubrobacter aplysinae TaxID=909625 RepID=UPI00064BD5B6
MLPVMAGMAPFALIAGAAPIQEGVSAAGTIGLSVVVFAGAAQLAAAQLIGSGAAPVLVVLTVAVINLRFVMYSASLAPYLGSPPARWKALVSYLLTDQAYAVAVTRFSSPEAREAEGNERAATGVAGRRVGYFVGAALPLWAVWQVGTVAGVILGARVPEALELDFAIPLVFLALLFPALTDRASVVAALGAGTVALLGAGLPLNLGLIAAILAGILAGLAWPFPGRGGR